MDEFIKKETTFNGGELFWLFEAPPEVRKEWERRITCALCFARKFFAEQGIETETPYRVFLCASFTQVKSLLYEKSGGRFILQPNAASAVLGNSLFAEQKTKSWMDVHEYVHILMNNLRKSIWVKENKQEQSDFPLWYTEGLAHYVQGKKDDTNYFEMARSLEFLPPFVLKAMNIPTQKFWMEFGIMDQHIITGNHPGLTACASFVQFLIEKQGIRFKNIWELVDFQDSINGFYQRIVELADNSLFNILNNYLYYVDKPLLPKGQRTWEMPVAVARDFRGEFTFENKSFEVLQDVLET